MLAANVRSGSLAANSANRKPAFSRANRTGANRRERLLRIDKLEVTCSSPVPPTQEAPAQTGLFLCGEENCAAVLAAETAIFAAARDELRAHRERQATRGFGRIRPGALVFQTSSGRSPGRRNALRALQTAAVNAGLVKDDQEPIGLNDLRHSLAANSFALGLTDVEVARLLRHAKPKVTLTVYADLVEDEASTRLGQKLTAEGFGS